MTREDKKQKRLLRSKNRKKLRMQKYLDKIHRVKGNPQLTLNGGFVSNMWDDPNSPTGYSQNCEWPMGSICQSPCNGDC
jgi:hypothetical protein